MSNLYFFTENYPYGSAENFIENEIEVLSEEFDNVYIIPRLKIEGEREIPSNCKVINVDLPESSSTLFTKNLLFIFKTLFLEFVKCKSKWFFLKKVRKWNSILLQNISLANNLDEKINSTNNDYFLSFWMNDWALALSYLKHTKKINGFSFKVLGYDIYDERHEGNYLPFRYTNYKYTNKVYAVSKFAQEYIKQKGFFKEKIGLCHLGTRDHGASEIVNDGIVKVYSCSNVIPLKRVDKIARLLSKVKTNVYWVHQGEGDAIGDVEEIVAKFPENIKFYHSKRFKNTKEMMMFIKNENFDIMMHLSETEGFGVVQPEALSFGIPVITTNVGAAPEYMSDKLGLLVDVEFDESKIIKFIENYGESEFSKEYKREEIREFWKHKFYYKTVCKRFIDDFKSN